MKGTLYKGNPCHQDDAMARPICRSQVRGRPAGFGFVHHVQHAVLAVDHGAADPHVLQLWRALYRIGRGASKRSIG